MPPLDVAARVRTRLTSPTVPPEDRPIRFMEELEGDGRTVAAALALLLEAGRRGAGVAQPRPDPEAA